MFSSLGSLSSHYGRCDMITVIALDTLMPQRFRRMDFLSLTLYVVVRPTNSRTCSTSTNSQLGERFPSCLAGEGGYVGSGITCEWSVKSLPESGLCHQLRDHGQAHLITHGTSFLFNKMKR